MEPIIFSVQTVNSFCAGWTSWAKAFNGYAANRAYGWAYFIEILLGMMSPKTSRSKVPPPIAIPTPILPKILMAMDVITTDIAILTNSLPI